MNSLITTAELHLQRLCSDIGERPVGSSNNRAATDYCKSVLRFPGIECTETELSVLG